MCAIHLGVVELERQFQRRPEKSLMIFAPDDEWIVKNTAVHADGAVDLGIHDGGGADDHAVGQIVIFTAFRYFVCQPQVVGAELRKVGGERHIAGADLVGFVFTIVFTAMLSYCSSSRSTGSR